MKTNQAKTQTSAHIEAQVLLKARELSRTLHKGQKYGEEDYFEAHIKEVFTLACVEYEPVLRYLGLNITDVGIVALLHDAKEDTLVTDQEILEVLKGLPKSRCSAILRAINSLTKAPGEKYFDYIISVLRTRDPLTIFIKLADATVNLKKSASSGDEVRQARYRKVLKLLSTPHESLHLKI